MHPLRGRVVALMQAAGVQPGGPGECDPQVADPRFYGRVLREGSLGLGESWMDGWWTVGSLDGMLYRLMEHGIDDRVPGLHAWLDALRAFVLNLQSGRRALAVGERHYDLGNDLFEAMLGKRLVYSCGYWREATTLDAAQEAKLDLVCRKLGLRPGMRVLDIGCGWGEALKFAAERYGVSGVGVTISREQADYARRLCAGLPVDIRLQDYRALDGASEDTRFDRIFSIGMFEHVGAKNYRAYFEVARRCLKGPEDLFLLHCIGNNVSVRHTDPWIARYIFPNSMLPSARQVAEASEGLFVMEDWHNFGPDYDLTLQAWRANIEAAWDALPSRYDERFRRMWRFYLAASMAAFRARRIQLWQVVYSPHGVPGGYVAPRYPAQLRPGAPHRAFTPLQRRGCGNARMTVRSQIMILHLRHARGLERDEGRVRARAAGEEANELYPGQPWTEVEPRVAGDWRRVRGGSPLSWSQVREDAHSAWQVAWLQHGDCLRDHAPIRD